MVVWDLKRLEIPLIYSNLAEFLYENRRSYHSTWVKSWEPYGKSLGVWDDRAAMELRGWTFSRMTVAYELSKPERSMIGVIEQQNPAKQLKQPVSFFPMFVCFLCNIGPHWAKQLKWHLQFGNWTYDLSMEHHLSWVIYWWTIYTIASC